ncbi:phosphatase PAP2 family protein [Dasania sp. GY-MA-18]|uniref:undecaprenyl-diphosphate phosphatase n=1 Tax=Dasania phycosphaerae TaxID=2950436 RepID=A0A9J6RNV5_9GAMM|nr:MULTISPECIES: phosphatase PAP2 family protein [Dasania]MCR8923253.1 phosphatase PAP2 family protein [Dasania sp. GY-MA-18]MCZ0865685.1 phosphatase PAP2 family protein [Dasania phycosphaerae]MCZ0869410.1 phosphatase PAP2 family protein [Dasania phycosphaerae]
MTVFDGITHYDRRMLIWCSKSRYYPCLITGFRVISRSGDGYVQLLLPLLLLAFDYQAYSAFVQLMMMAFAIERLLYLLLKNALKRPRPPEAIPSFCSIVRASDQFSFPSGHTMAAFLLAGLCAMQFPYWALPLYGWALLVGVSRVIMGVHFPSDILAGATLGCSIAAVVRFMV